MPFPPAASRTKDAGRPRLLMDLSTSLAWRGQHAVGIVRTEREIAVRLLDSHDLCVVPVVYHDGHFRAIDPDFARDLISAVVGGDTKPAGAISPTDAEMHRPWLAWAVGPAAAFARLAARSILAAVPRASREEVRLSLIYARQAVRHLMYRRGETAAGADATEHAVTGAPLADGAEPDLSLIVHPEPTDVLFLGGLGWDVTDWRRLSSLRAATGVRVVSVMYDLIPVKFPEFLGAPSDYFQNYFLHVVDNCERIFCISRCTQVDFAKFVEDSRRPPVPTEVIYLGANVPARADDGEFTDPAVRERLRRGRFALAVGTFEIRKNYPLLIDLWEDLLRDPGFDLDLVIVGMPGWRADDVIARLEALPGFGSRIFWFKRLSDSGLSWLYEQCLVLLFPSLYEGWGLPVVEALQHGRPVIASDRGATPEAGFGHATILDPLDHAAWREALLAAARGPRQVAAVEPGLLPDWDGTAATVERGILDMMRTGANAA